LPGRYGRTQLDTLRQVVIGREKAWAAILPTTGTQTL
jgi:hypothetical protein